MAALKVVSRHLYGRVLTDLKSILIHPAVQQYLLADDGLVQLVLQMVGMLQGTSLADDALTDCHQT